MHDRSSLYYFIIMWYSFDRGIFFLVCTTINFDSLKDLYDKFYSLDPKVTFTL